MTEILAIIGAFIAIEGALYAGAPHVARKLAAMVTEMSDRELRSGGLIALALGVGIVWLVRG
ncbi:MAG: DUF2065 domain-containing protein [Pseudomonadota bacterium]